MTRIKMTKASAIDEKKLLASAQNFVEDNAPGDELQSNWAASSATVTYSFMINSGNAFYGSSCRNDTIMYNNSTLEVAP